jgi:hypothetical protein
MRFPNAYEGVKKIFTAEILALIARVCVLVAAIGGLAAVGAVAVADSVDGDSVIAVGLAGAGLSGIFGVAAGVIAIIAFILQIVGINKAKADEPAFKTAMIFILVAIAASGVGSIFSSSETLQSIAQIVTDVAGLCVTLYIIQGIKSLADRLNNGAVSAKGNQIFLLIAVMYGVVLLANLIGLFAPTIAGVLAIVAAVVGIVQYFFFLSYLSQAKKMLAA